MTKTSFLTRYSSRRLAFQMCSFRPSRAGTGCPICCYTAERVGRAHSRHSGSTGHTNGREAVGPPATHLFTEPMGGCGVSSRACAPVMTTLRPREALRHSHTNIQGPHSPSVHLQGSARSSWCAHHTTQSYSAKKGENWEQLSREEKHTDLMTEGRPVGTGDNDGT